MAAASPQAQLLEAIDKLFVESVGPFGQVIVQDTKALWKRKQWHGASAFRNYVKTLADNIDSNDERNEFIQATSRLVANAKQK